MKTEFHDRCPKDQEDAISVVNAAIRALDLAENTSTITPAKTVFGSVSVLLTFIRARFLFFYNDLLQIHACIGLKG